MGIANPFFRPFRETCHAHSKYQGFMQICTATQIRGFQRQFWENICSEDDLRSIIFGTFVVKFLACQPLLGFSNI